MRLLVPTGFKQYLFAFAVFHFSLSAVAQVGIGEVKIDSLISKNRPLNSNDQIVYYIYSSFDIRSGLYFIDLDDNGFKYLILKDQRVFEGKIKRRVIKKLKTYFVKLSGNKHSSVYVDDGCEGKILFYNKSSVIYSYYFLGNVPDEIRPLYETIRKATKDPNILKSR